MTKDTSIEGGLFLSEKKNIPICSGIHIGENIFARRIIFVKKNKRPTDRRRKKPERVLFLGAISDPFFVGCDLDSLV